MFRQDITISSDTMLFDCTCHRAGNVLDVGGGIGATSTYLKDLGRAERVFVIRYHQGRVFVGCRCTCINQSRCVNAFAEINETFDTILCLDVLEHLVNPWSYSAIDSLAASGGCDRRKPAKLRHWTSCIPLVVKGTFDLADKGLLDRTHMRWFTRKSAVELMTCSGLKLKHIEGRLPAARWRIANALTLGRMRGLVRTAVSDPRG
jgi:hypothetical protein